MSKVLSSVAVTEFDSMVKHAYQGVGKLKSTVTMRNNVTADTYKFRKMGKGLANQKSTADLVTPMDINHEFAVATLQNWTAPEYTDIFDQAEVNFDEKNELAEAIAGALGRRFDQLVVDALDASTPLATAIAEGGTNLTVAKLIAAKVALVNQGVGDADLFFIANANGLSGLLNDTKITSEDYATVKALVNGTINSFMGFTFNFLEEREEGGLTIVSDIVDSYAYHRAAVGVAQGFENKTSIDWIADRTAWLSNGMLKAGSVVRDTGGLVKVEYDETA
ncbi:MAG: hypothetical protein GY829_12480 [Gammaproteobacteria bacterium]|nr:hypothetical protein [Gammaproteobacteria bacterium]